VVGAVEGQDELARRRAVSTGHPSTFQRELGGPVPGLPSLPLLERRRVLAGTQLAEAATALRDLQHQLAGNDDASRVSLALARERVRTAVDRLAAAGDRVEAARVLHRSSRDQLTGLLSRDAGLERLRQELERAARSGEDLTVAFLDVDGLKQVNDSKGHLAGDALLRSLGSALLHCLRGYDVVLRYGGDELVAALPGLTPAGAGDRMDDVASALAELHAGATVSVGLALAHRHDDLYSVLQRADDDLYARRRARQAGLESRKSPDVL
jgi:diguanylate cyclase (GGDEF)-like protein